MLKAGFIGLGRMGITHFSILNTHPAVKIATICDQSETMIKIIKKYINIKTYSDYQKMMNEEKLDFVIISTPSDSHAEIIKNAIINNINIFVEKPFAMNSDQGNDIITQLEGSKLVNQVGYVNRFNEVFIEVKNLIDSGIIGNIVNFSSEMYGATVLKNTGSSWRSRRNTGGGCMYEFASHCIDLAIYLFGRPDEVSGSIMRSIYSQEVEDMVCSTLYYDQGYTGMIMVNWSDEAYRKPTNILKIFGTKGKIIADKHVYRIYMREADEERGFRKGWNTRYITDFAQSVRFYVRGNEFTRQLDYFIDCIQEGNYTNISSFEEALKTDVVMEQIEMDAFHMRSSMKDDSSSKEMKRGNGKTTSIFGLFKKEKGK